MKTINLLGLAVAIATFSACTNDTEEVLGQDTEIRLTSEITPSRVTSLDYQSTQIVANQQVGITITGAKADHKNVAWTAGADGALTNTGNAIYYGTGTATITAYHPHNSAWTGTSHTFSVSTDQSIEANYRNSDLLWATASSGKTANAVALTFTHKLAKINVTLVPEEEGTNLSGATISICGTNIATNFNPSTGALSAATANVQEIKAGITTTTDKTASAIIVPQTIAASTPFIKVTLGEKIFYHKLSAEKTFASGKSYSYTLTVKEKKVEVDTEGDIDNWENGDGGNTGDANEENVSSYNNGVAYIAKAGELPTVIPSEEKLTITSLKITGELNGTDIKYLREMAGSNTALTATGKLVSLDLSDTVIVEGGEYYATAGQWEDSSSETYQKYTEDNVLGEFMFYGCKLTELILPTTIIFVGQYCFSNCDALAGITIPEGVQTIGAAAFYHCDKLKDITLPENLTTMGGTVFGWCAALNNIPEWPANIKTIPSNCFQSCTALTTVTIPDNVTTIGAYAFSDCTELTQITLPSSVTTYNQRAFSGCSSLAKVINYRTPPANLNYTDIFSGIKSNATLYVPYESLSNYKSTSYQWYNVFGSNIRAIESL